MTAKKFGLPGARVLSGLPTPKPAPHVDVYSTDPTVILPEPRHFTMPPLATLVSAPGDWDNQHFGQWGKGFGP